MMKRHWVLLVLVIIVVLGGVLRFHNLAKHSFWGDEFFHVFSAQELIEQGKPYLPSGHLYERAYSYTWLVSLFFRVFGVSEFSARLPSVLFGILVIPLVYFFVSRFSNRTAALISAFLIAFSPDGILYSQQCRMYTLFQLLYLCSVFLLWEALKDTGRRKKIIGCIFITVYLFALHIHEFAALLFPAAVIYLLIWIIYEPGVFLGIRRAIVSRRMLTVAVLAAAAFAGIFMRHRLMNALIGAYQALRSVPVWSLPRNQRYYHDFLLELYPVYYRIYPLIAIYLMMKIKKKGAYLACSFLVPFLLLSIVIGWKGYRYLYAFLPLFLISAAIGTDYFLRAFIPSIKNIFLKILIAGSIAYAVCLPWIKADVSRFADTPLFAFKEIVGLVDTITKDELVIVTEPFHIEYYCRRKPDYMINSFENTGVKRASYIDKEGRSCDYIGGIPLIENLAELHLVLSSGKKVLLITNEYFLKKRVLESDLREYILAHFTKIPVSVEARPFYVYEFQREAN